MTLDIYNARMMANDGMFVVHEPRGHGKKTTVEVVVLPVLICSWWRYGKAFDINYPDMMVGIVSQSFQ